MSSIRNASAETALPDGAWIVDRARSDLRFSSRGMFGLAKVDGRFERSEGEMTVDGGDVQGELRIEAASLDTGNARRDTHLRSADFFDVDHHPIVRFVVLSTSHGVEGLELTGELHIRENRLRLTTPLVVESGGAAGELRLRIDTSVDRAAAGVGWNKIGMIKGPARLSADVALTPRAASASAS